MKKTPISRQVNPVHTCMQCCSALFGVKSSDGLVSDYLMSRLKEALEDVNATSLGVKPSDIPDDSSQVRDSCFIGSIPPYGRFFNMILAIAKTKRHAH